MKIAFDENMPMALVRTFQTLARDKGFRRSFGNLQIVSAKKYTPSTDDADYSPKNDVPWMARYRRARGRVFISGDVKMPKVPHELLAIEELGLVAFFLPPVWNNWRHPRKIALIFAWLERVVEQGKIAKPGSLYRIESNWDAEAPLHVIPSPGPLRLAMRTHPVQPRKRRLAARKPGEPDRSIDLFSLNGTSDNEGREQTTDRTLQGSRSRAWDG